MLKYLHTMRPCRQHKGKWGVDMNLRKMKYFVDAVELGNFSMVARKNFISQTAISQQMTAIENEVGTSLFDRQSSGVKVNAQGLLLYNFCRSTLAAYQETLGQIKDSLDSGKKNITIAITQVGSEMIPDMLSVFGRKFSDIIINVRTSALTEMAEQLKNGEVDLAIGPIYEFEDSGLIETEILYSENSGVIMAKTSALAEKEHLNMDDLAGETVIMLAREGGKKSHEHLINAFRSVGFAPPRTIEVTDMKAQAVLVSAGMGIAFVTENANIDRESNVFRVIDKYNDTVSIALAWKKNTADKTVRQFIKCCVG